MNGVNTVIDLATAPVERAGIGYSYILLNKASKRVGNIKDRTSKQYPKFSDAGQAD